MFSVSNRTTKTRVRAISELPLKSFLLCQVAYSLRPLARISSRYMHIYMLVNEVRHSKNLLEPDKDTQIYVSKRRGGQEACLLTPDVTYAFGQGQ